MLTHTHMLTYKVTMRERDEVEMRERDLGEVGGIWVRWEEAMVKQGKQTRERKPAVLFFPVRPYMRRYVRWYERRY